MNSDDDQLVGISLLELFELRENMDAVNAAVSPEIEQYEFSFQVLLAQGTAYIEPFHIFRKVRNADPLREWVDWIISRWRVGIDGPFFRFLLGLFFRRCFIPCRRLVRL